MQKVKQTTKKMNPIEFRDWIKELKVRRYATEKAMSIAINTELLEFYWEIGKEICVRQEIIDLEVCFIKQISGELEQEMPNVGGFSVRNLYAVRQWYLLYSQRYSSLPSFALQVPWSYHRLMITQTRDFEELEFYCNEAFKNQWNRETLSEKMKNKLFEKVKSSILNANVLSVWDSWTCHDDMFSEAQARDLMNVLPGLLLNQGLGFAFMGRQLSMNVGEEDYFVDMLFYHTELRCYVVVKFKSGFCLPEHSEKMSRYLSAIGLKVEKPGDHATIGLVVYQDCNRFEVKYAFPLTERSNGFVEYKLTARVADLPETKLPNVQIIESALSVLSKENDKRERGVAVMFA